MSDLTPERRDKMRRAVTECTIPMDSTMWPISGPSVVALLNAADERDRLAAAIERIEHDARCPHPKCPGHGMCCCPEAKP